MCSVTLTDVYTQVCIPLWCNCAKQADFSTDVQSHSKVVRIPPGESVVLNSAERAPYLLVVEVLHGELHFDPSIRANKELLTRVARDKPGKKGIRDAINSPQGVVPESVGEPSTALLTFAADSPACRNKKTLVT